MQQCTISEDIYIILNTIFYDPTLRFGGRVSYAYVRCRPAAQTNRLNGLGNTTPYIVVCFRTAAPLSYRYTRTENTCIQLTAKETPGEPINPADTDVGRVVYGRSGSRRRRRRRFCCRLTLVCVCVLQTPPRVYKHKQRYTLADTTLVYTLYNTVPRDKAVRVTAVTPMCISCVRHRRAKGPRHRVRCYS